MSGKLIYCLNVSLDGYIENAKPIVVFSSTLTDVVPNARVVAGDVGERLAEVRRGSRAT